MAVPKIKFVQIQTHSRCNADCVFCPYIESWHAHHPGVIKPELWQKVLRELEPFKDIRQGKVCVYFMQEPLIDKTIFDKIEDVYRTFPGTTLEISTNGAALTEGNIDKLIHCLAGRNHQVWVSHHGIDAKTLEYVMKIDYDRAHHNLINLLKRAEGRLRLLILGAGESRDGKKTYFTSEQYRAHWQKYFEKNRINTDNVDVEAFTFHDRAGTLHRMDREAYKMNVGKVRDIGPGHPDFYCKRIDQWVHVMYDGKIRICCMDYHGEVDLPSLTDLSLMDYFKSEAYTNLCAMVSGRKESPPDFICKRCISPGG